MATMEPGRCRRYTGVMRLRFVFLAGAILGAILGYYALWSHLMGRMEAALLAFQAQQQAQGRSLDFAGWQRGGFPYRLSLRIDGLSWSDPRGAGWALHSASLVAHQQLWNTQHIVFELIGSQNLAWRDGSGGAANSAEHRLGAVSGLGRASLVLDGGGRWLRFAADLQDVRFNGRLQGQDMAEFQAGRLQLHLRQAGNVPPSEDVALQIETLTLPASWDGPLGRQVAALHLIGKQTGPWIGATPQAALAGWRDAGGIIEFSNILLQWGPVRLSGDGSLTVDKQFRPLGAMGGRLLGAPAGIDALVAAGKMSAAEAAAAKAALASLHRTEDNGDSVLPLPLTAQNGRLSIAHVALFPLAPLFGPALAPIPAPAPAPTPAPKVAPKK